MTVPVSDLDTGSKGKRFEATLLKAFDLVGLKYTKNSTSGALWDYRPTGDGWNKLIDGRDVNIKVFSTLWLFGSAELGRLLPWDKVPEDFDKEAASAKVRKYLLKRKIATVAFLRPADAEIQSAVVQAVGASDKKKLDSLLVKKNFKIDRLGTGFGVRVSIKDDRIGSIAIDKDGKVWARSERPRKMGGSMMVTFRSPKTGPKSQPNRKVKIGEDMIEKLIEEVAQGADPTEVLERFAVQHDPRYANNYSYAATVKGGTDDRPDRQQDVTSDANGMAIAHESHDDKTHYPYGDSDMYHYPLHNTIRFPRGAHETNAEKDSHMTDVDFVKKAQDFLAANRAD